MRCSEFGHALSSVQKCRLARRCATVRARRHRAAPRSAVDLRHAQARSRNASASASLPMTRTRDASTVRVASAQARASRISRPISESREPVGDVAVRQFADQAQACARRRRRAQARRRRGRARTPRANASGDAAAPRSAHAAQDAVLEQRGVELAGHARREVDDGPPLDARPFAVRAGQHGEQPTRPRRPRRASCVSSPRITSGTPCAIARRRGRERS